MARPRIEFDGNLRADEDDGRESMYLERTGSSRDLRNESKVLITIDWDGSSLSPHDIEFDRSRADGNEVSTISHNGRIIGILVTFPPGEDRVRIPWKIIDDTEHESNERLNLELTAISNAVITDDDAYIRVYDNDEPPLLSVVRAGDVDEGDHSLFFVELSSAASEDVQVRVRTNPDRGSATAGEDYEPIDIWVTIPAGMTRYPIVVKTLSDNIAGEGDEQFWIEAVSVSGGDVQIDTSDDDGAGYIADQTPTPLDPSLQIYKDVIDALVDEGGIETAAEVITSNSVLFNAAAILQSEEALPDGLWAEVNPSGEPFGGNAALFLSLGWQAKLLFGIAGVTYKSVTGRLFTPDAQYGTYTEGESQDWTEPQVEVDNNQTLKAGDYVDGRLVINQPVIGFDSAGDQFVFSSWQGRNEAFDPNPDEMTSHQDGAFLAHSFDWGGSIAGANPVYIVAPIDGYVIYADDIYTVADGLNANSGLGNVVTMRAVQTDGNGNPIYLTFAHLETESIPKYLETTPVSNPATNTSRFIQAGEIIGIMGTTGYSVTNHGHITVGNNKIPTRSGALVADGSEEANPNGPPVYMIFSDEAQIAERHELSPNITSSDGLEQDYGFPIGDSDAGEPAVVTGIHSTFTRDEFIALNQDVVSEYQGLQAADWFIFT